MTVEHHPVLLRKVKQEDWTWIKTWFEDEWLNCALGPVDEDWLKLVLSTKDGEHLVAEVQDMPIGLIEVVWAKPDNPFHGITDLAIDPDLRRKGLGRRVLAEVLIWEGHPKTGKWVAFVDKNNEPPMKLLRSSGWIDEGIHNNMRRFRFDT